jgi:hypothetical protein
MSVKPGQVYHKFQDFGHKKTAIVINYSGSIIISMSIFSIVSW